MRPPRARFFRAATLALGLLATPTAAQPFTRVTDPTNPVVTDAHRSGGGVWADFDGDGDLDLFVANGNQAPQPSALYLNDGAGGFTAVTTGPIATDAGSAIGGTAADYDGDGHLDLYVTRRALADETRTTNALYRGGPDGFTRVTDGPVATDLSDGNSSSWVDVDDDGDLDLFVTNFNQPGFLYRNDGGALVRAEATPLTTLTSLSIVGAWADADDDGDADYFRGNGGPQNDALYRNDGALAFTAAPFTDGRATLGASWGDYDNDGDLDLVVAHFLNQNDALYRNAGAPTHALAPVAAPPLTTDGGSSVGTAWGDYDNDGDLDLFVARFGGDNALYANGGPPDYAFTRVPDGPGTGDGGSSFGAAWADYDGDGDLDLFVANQNDEPNFLYRNGGAAGHWLALDLRGRAPNTSAIGARVLVRAVIGGVERVLRRDVPAQTGYNSQTLRLHVGLGDAAVATEVRVAWPDGTEDVLTDVLADRLLTITAGTTPAEPGAGSSSFGLNEGRPNPSRDATTIRYTLAATAAVRLAVYDAAGREVAVLAEGERRAGSHEVSLDARALTAGVYVLRLRAGELVRTRRLTVQR